VSGDDFDEFGELAGIASDLGRRPVDGGDGYCAFCGARLDGRDHPRSCLWQRAVDWKRRNASSGA
jgi:hypothetical protein